MRECRQYLRWWKQKTRGERYVESAIAGILKDRGDSIRLSAFSKLEYFKSGKLEIPIQLRVPPRCERSSCPVIVNVYGDGSCFSGGYEWRSEIFLQAGFIVAELNIRGSSCPNRQWEDAAKGKNKFEALTDIQACGEFLKRRFKRHGHWGIRLRYNRGTDSTLELCKPMKVLYLSQPSAKRVEFLNPES
jgi:hypothetical protein